MTGTSVRLEKLSSRQKDNITAYVAGKTDTGMACTMATFTGAPAHMTRCGVVKVELKRRSGQLFVNASWDVESDIKAYFVKYRENVMNSFENTVWTKEESQDGHLHTVKNLSSSVSYEVQVQCVSTPNCPQCVQSNAFIVPQELSREPIIKHTAVEPHQGRRKVTITWKSPSTLGVREHHVRVQKASREFAESFTADGRDSSISFLLSHSGYEVSLYSSNNVSQSPSAPPWAIGPALGEMECHGALSVAFNSNHSFNLSWSDLLAEYECYTVEWFLKGQNHTPSFLSFSAYENQTTIDTEEDTPSGTAFYPYKRYVFFLHVKEYKDDTCNLKQINNSDITCGWTEAYLQEGTPIGAPQNVSQSGVTDSTAVITWRAVPEEELRGFLRGYVVHYTSDGTTSNVTVGPTLHSCELSGLRSRSSYQVEVAAFTSSGEGRRSFSLHFETSPSDPSAWILAGVIIGTALLLVAVNLCFRLLNRVKAVLWPSIPNPGNSSAMQKTDREHELEVLEPASGLKLQEDWASGPLYLMDFRKEEVKHAAVRPLLDELGHDESDQGLRQGGGVVTPPSRSEEEGCLQSTGMGTTEIDPTPLEGATKIAPTPLEGDRVELGGASTTETPCQRTDMVPAPTAIAPAADVPWCDPKTAVAGFMSDYTTMELFQQATVVATQAGCQPCQPASAVPAWPSEGAAGLDYIHQSHLTMAPSPSSEEGTHDTATTPEL
ncbi:hypothetical protein ACEWY4_004775 [Coilia grayii]|uniref:Fibronectin type-III domain-containing protein n=1 Tax=Coilia grayii TaxID=363190 RepID=A0ABD1KN30_9TELE